MKYKIKYKNSYYAFISIEIKISVSINNSTFLLLFTYHLVILCIEWNRLWLIKIYNYIKVRCNISLDNLHFTYQVKFKNIIHKILTYIYKCVIINLVSLKYNLVRK